MQPFGVAPPGFRLPAGTRVGELHLRVSDLARSARFYESALGFRVLSTSGDSVSLGAQGDEARPLVHLHGGDAVRPSPGGRLGLYHFAILLPDRAALGRLVKHLARRRVAMGGGDHLVSEAIYLDDPDRLGIELYSDRPREGWQHEGRELVMATEPLDMDDLMRGAGEWGGLPAGSRVGHVHLHVGDLREAERFYHAALGLDKVVWSYPGALFFSAGGYHHHLGTNTWGTGTPPAQDEARLLSWELLVPGGEAAAAAARSLQTAGFEVEHSGGAFSASDPWGTRVQVAAEQG